MTDVEDDVTRAVRVVLRPLASPLPLGFLGLGGGTIVLTAQQLGWVPGDQFSLVAAAVLVLAVPLQGLACILGFLARDPVASTAMGVLSATWATIGLLTLLSQPAPRTPVLGVLLFFLATALVIPAALAVLGKGLAAIVLGLAVMRFAATGVYEYTGVVGWRVTAGWVGLALCVVALVAAAAFGFEDARRVGLVATLRRGRGERAVTAGGLDTVGPVARVAGVRDQL